MTRCLFAFALLLAVTSLDSPGNAAPSMTTGTKKAKRTLVLFLPDAVCGCKYEKNAATSGSDLNIHCPNGTSIAATLNTSNYTTHNGDCAADCNSSTDQCRVSYDVSLTWNPAETCRAEVWVKHPEQSPPGCERVTRGNDDIEATLQGQSQCKPHDDTEGATGKFQVFTAAGCDTDNLIAESHEGFFCRDCELPGTGE